MSHHTTETAQIPEPSLEYHFWGRGDCDPDIITDDSVRLYSVHKVSVSRNHEGVLYAYLSGPMRKRDGERGRHSRCVRVLPHPDQPHWLTALFADAVLRLPGRLCRQCGPGYRLGDEGCRHA